ncbi:MAG: hypothetical protein II861_06325, partial [Methanomicrobium sp.]|nr:hypothetical protein [Methanomicrobium sp.]
LKIGVVELLELVSGGRSGHALVLLRPNAGSEETFGENAVNYARFSYAASRENIAEALRRIATAV